MEYDRQREVLLNTTVRALVQDDVRVDTFHHHQSESMVIDLYREDGVRQEVRVPCADLDGKSIAGQLVVIEQAIPPDLLRAPS